MSGMADDELARCIALAVLGEPGYLSAARIFRQEIEAAGYVLVERDRWERLRSLASGVLTWSNRGHVTMDQIGLQPGDLDGDV